MAFLDLHSHILPGLDDGARDAAASLAMIRGLVALGFDTICATPHQKSGQFLPALESIRAAHVATRAAVDEAGIAVRIGLGAENMWDTVFYERTQARAIPSYDEGRAFLFELPVTASLPTGLEEHVHRLRMAGYLPVLAHPERYQPLWQAPALVERLAAQCALVVDLGAVAGYHGRPQGKLARRLIEQGTAHAVASDVHTPEDVRVAAEGMMWIRKQVGEAALVRLLDENPRRIVAGEHPGA
jgi:protein-tyrosine phosphatase